MSRNAYAKKIHSILAPQEKAVFAFLHSPSRIQDFLEGIPINFELTGETNYSPRMLLRNRLSHCFEGAVFAAAVLAYHGQKPLLMDFATAYNDEDHAVALFKKNKRWGAISKTNHAVLRYRDPVYETPRELALSYFNEYSMWDGKKSLRGYSAPFDLSQFEPTRWITTETSLDWLMEKVARSRYYDVAPAATLRNLRRASPIELKALEHIEWPDTRKKRG